MQGEILTSAANQVAPFPERLGGGATCARGPRSLIRGGHFYAPPRSGGRRPLPFPLLPPGPPCFTAAFAKKHLFEKSVVFVPSLVFTRFLYLGKRLNVSRYFVALEKACQCNFGMETFCWEPRGTWTKNIRSSLLGGVGWRGFAFLWADTCFLFYVACELAPVTPTDWDRATLRWVIGWFGKGSEEWGGALGL